jgi:hypothetical protein
MATISDPIESVTIHQQMSTVEVVAKGAIPFLMTNAKS